MFQGEKPLSENTQSLFEEERKEASEQKGCGSGLDQRLEQV